MNTAASSSHPADSGLFYTIKPAPTTGSSLNLDSTGTAAATPPAGFNSAAQQPFGATSNTPWPANSTFGTPPRSTLAASSNAPAASPPAVASSPSPAYKMRLRGFKSPHLASPANRDRSQFDPATPRQQGYATSPRPGAPHSPEPTQQGRWIHPDFYRLSHLRLKQGVTATTFKRLQVNAGVLIGLLILSYTTPYTAVRGFLTNVIGISSSWVAKLEFSVCLILSYNVLEMIWKFIKPGATYNELGLTPEQRRLLGLDPSIKPAPNSPPPVSPPRYQRRPLEDDHSQARQQSPTYARLQTTAASPQAPNPTLGQAISPFRTGNLTQVHSSPLAKSGLKFRPITNLNDLNAMLGPQDGQGSPTPVTMVPSTSLAPANWGYQTTGNTTLVSPTPKAWHSTGPLMPLAGPTDLFGSYPQPPLSYASPYGAPPQPLQQQCGTVPSTAIANSMGAGSSLMAISPGPSLPFIGAYQTAPPNSPPYFKDTGKKGKHAKHPDKLMDKYTPDDVGTLLVNTLHLSPMDLDQLAENTRRWFSAHILEPLVTTIQTVDDALLANGLEHLSCAKFNSLQQTPGALAMATATLKPPHTAMNPAVVATPGFGAGMFGNAAKPTSTLGFGGSTTTSSYGGMSASSATSSTKPQTLTELAARYGSDMLVKTRLKLEMYLAVPNCPSRQYVIDRIRTLAISGVVASYTSDGGAQEVTLDGGGTKPWTSPPYPTDAQLLFHLFCAYMDLITPGASLEANGGRPFSFRYIVQADQEPDPNQTLQIKQFARPPSHFAVLYERVCYEVPMRRDSLFFAVATFLLLAKEKEAGYLGLLNVSTKSVGLDLLTSRLSINSLISL
ncbi:hypothetical protein H4R35_004015 [Dimargaris xerosporica]|nr:hypothetical protein H4R35_004015 [Dimargaris xerosporica]